MPEYIEREAVLSILDGLYQKHLTMHNYSADSATLDCIEAVIEAPTADVAEVKRGEWVREVDEDDIFEWTKCSNCGEDAIITDAGDFCLSDFCPCCGADMRGKGEK